MVLAATACSDHTDVSMTRAQYEAALAAGDLQCDGEGYGVTAVDGGVIPGAAAVSIDEALDFFLHNGASTYSGPVPGETTTPGDTGTGFLLSVDPPTGRLGYFKKGRLALTAGLAVDAEVWHVTGISQCNSVQSDLRLGT
jgi:hypothetical protein